MTRTFLNIWNQYGVCSVSSLVETELEKEGKQNKVFVPLPVHTAGCAWQCGRAQRPGRHPHSWRDMGPGWRARCGDRAPSLLGRHWQPDVTFLHFGESISSEFARCLQVWAAGRGSVCSCSCLNSIQRPGGWLGTVPASALQGLGKQPSSVFL